MLEMHVVGGIEYMAPLSLLFLVNIGIFLFLTSSYLRKQYVNRSLLETIRQVGLLALAYGVFGTVMAFMLAFRSLSEIKETLPFQVIMGGLEVAMITCVYGLIIFIVSLLFFLTVKFMSKKQQVEA